MKRNLFEGCGGQLIAYLVVIAITIALCLCFGGCKTPKPIVTENRTNTLIDRETLDSLIGVAADQARMQLALQCDSLGNIYISQINTLNGERTQLQIALRAAQDALSAQDSTSQPPDTQKPAKPQIIYLDVDCNSDSLQLLVTKLRERITTIESNKEKETVKVEVVPNYYRNCTRGFWVLLVFAVLVVGWKVAKIYFKIQSGGIL